MRLCPETRRRIAVAVASAGKSNEQRRAAPSSWRWMATPAIRHRACQYISGEPRQPDMRMCGAPVRPGCSWCADHARIVFEPRVIRAA